MKRVIAYTMHEAETASALKHLANPAQTPGYIMGEADDDGIKRLRRKGLAVEIIGDASEGRAPAPVTWPQAMRPLTPPRPPSPLRGAPRVAAKALAMPAKGELIGGLAGRGPGRTLESADYEVSVAGPLVRAWRDELMSAGSTRIGERLVSSSQRQPTYLLRLTRDAARKVAALDFVTGVSAYEPQVPKPVASPRVAPMPSPTPAPPMRGGRGAPPKGVSRSRKTGGKKAGRVEGAKGETSPTSSVTAAGAVTALYEVLLPDPGLRVGALKAIAMAGITVRDKSERKVRLELAPNHALLARLTREFRAQVSPYVKPRKHLDLAGTLVGLGTPATQAFPFQGKGQLIGIADTGIDDAHPDLKDRILKKVALGRTRKTDDPDGHGTHVAGIAVGTGKASAKKFRGAAPKAQLYFQSLLDDKGELGGLPFELAQLFQPAYRAGVRIHNNSWGTLTRSRYTVSSYEVDEFVAAHPDMLIVVSAGNAGSAADPVDGQPRNAKRGYVDWRSIDAPASCKNALVVGASRSSRKKYGYAAAQYGEVWADDFRHLPMSRQTVSGDPESLAGFSSRGPCDDGRIKPDLIAPGTDIVAPKSSRAVDDNFWGRYPPNSAYAVMGGTSMAAPLVAGCAALVREYYITKRKHEPSAALLKATLVNGTRWLSGQDALADHQAAPNYHQGFGCVHMPSTVPTPSRASLQLAFDDAWRENSWHLAQAGDAIQYTVDVADATEELRICLAWTDAPGRSLQNLLGLLLEAPSANGKRTKLFGNAHRRTNIKGVDMENNVQIIRITKPTPGTHIMQVWAHEIVHPAQAFALVVTGALATTTLKREARLLPGSV